MPTTTDILLAELREECERVAGLIRRLEENPASERVRTKSSVISAPPYCICMLTLPDLISFCVRWSKYSVLLG